MYNDEGEVNDELRHRLPRSNKTDPLKSKSQVEEQIEEVKENQVEAETTDGVLAASGQNMAAARNSTIEDLERQIIQDDKPPLSGYDNGPALGGDKDKSHHGNQSTPGQSVPPRPYLPYMGMPTASMYMQPVAPYMSSYMGASFQPGNFLSPPRYFNPGMRPPAPFIPQRYSPSAAGSANTSGEHIDNPLMVGDLQSSSPGTGESGDPPGPSGDGQSKDTANSYPFRTSPFHNHTSPPFNPYMSDPNYARFTSGLNIAGHLSSPTRPEDQAKQVALLMAELDHEKACNKKLVDRLADAEIELETSKISLKVSSADHHCDTEAGKAAALVQEVHTAQKKRDELSQKRIKVANQERDEALLRLRQAEVRLDDQGYGTPERSDSDDLDEDDQGMEQLLARLGGPESGDGAEQECSTLLQRLEMRKRRQQEITAEEMQVILEQRDTALAKARRYEEELLRQQRQGADHNLKAKLAAVTQERDMALSQIKQLKDEIMTIRIYYSLHKSLSQDSHDQLNTYQSGSSKLGIDTSGEGDQVRKESNTSVAQLRAAEHENIQLEADLQKLEHSHQDSKDKIVKLERLVDILRRKLKGLELERDEEANEQ
ncbi:mirror-image polydactyly gene 1 protein-like isoform X2 [Mizuhopecten yessoensis]|nr:mirror-image polydactyly gene 1 protein-like isoform X2 [Mizuhopecten yessoensis]